jgi:hypothetical protein
VVELNSVLLYSNLLHYNALHLYQLLSCYTPSRMTNLKSILSWTEIIQLCNFWLEDIYLIEILLALI